MPEALKIFKISATVITLAIAFTYLTAQQVLRLSANDPQAEAAGNLQSILEQGEPAESFNSPTPVDPQKSLTTFAVVYDESGKPLAGSVSVDGQLPAPALEVLEQAKGKTDHRVTWQPKEGVKIASVVRHFGGQTPGYVLVGRSLAEIDQRAQQLLILSGISLGLSWLILGLMSAIFFGKGRQHHESHEHGEK